VETVLNVVVIFLVLASLFVVLFIFFPVLAKAYLIIDPSKNINRKLPHLLALFNNEIMGDNLGSIFVKLLKIGHYSHIKTGNHGNDFPGKRQYQGFLRYANSEIAKSIDALGDSLGKYVV